MKILVRNSDSVVIYADNDIILSERLEGKGWIDNNFNLSNATIVEADLPKPWSGAVYSYDGTWKIVDTNRYNELLQSAKDEKVSQLKERIAYEVAKPRVDTGLGYFVDGGRTNKDDFYSKWGIMADTETTTVKDADNVFRAGVTKADMQTIYRAIVKNGEDVLIYKWGKEAEIQACTTQAELDAIIL